jgi:hypothetical protein
MVTSSISTRLALVAAAVLLLAGCKSGSSGNAASAATTIPGSAPAPATAGTPTAADDGSPAPAPVAAASGHPAVTCQQLTLQQVQPFIGAKLTKVDVQFEDLGDASGQQCRFSGASDDEHSINVLVLKGSGAAAAYAGEVADEKDGQVDVPGVGDKAGRDKGSGGINALKGDIYCSTGVDNGLPAIGILESAANGTTNIGEDYYQEASIAVGTLCNRIFGSGDTTPDLSKLLAAAAAASTSASASASAQQSADSAFASTYAPAGSP